MSLVILANIRTAPEWFHRQFFALSGRLPNPGELMTLPGTRQLYRVAQACLNACEPGSSPDVDAQLWLVPSADTFDDIDARAAQG